PTVDPPPVGRTSHWKTKVDSGAGDVSSRNERPGWTSVSLIAWVPPAFVVIVPVAPVVKGPSICTACTSGFHLGQVRTSDHTCQTSSGLALVSRVLPWLAIVLLLSSGSR